MSLTIKMLSRMCVALLCIANVAVADEPQEDSFSAAQLKYFENKVRPILVKRCYECHGEEESDGGLSLSARSTLIEGGDSGPAIEPGDPENSLLIQAIHYDDVYQMPPESKLPEEEIKILEDWVRDSAPWPNHSEEVVAKAGEEFDIEGRKSEHWCWQPVTPPTLPDSIADSNAIDFLVDQKMKEHGLEANGPAKRSALLRRISYDLTGLPPSVELVEKFAVNESITRSEVIDQLLDSEHYGERWARHWMDLTRYAETYGHEFDYPISDAWRYRDYLIRAFNDDLRYDQFVTEHLAGDLVESPRLNPEGKYNESVLGTGFWFLGEATHGPVDAKEDEANRIDNQIDVMCRSFIGMTVACARCHDHKFDAISTQDYYALSGFLQSSRRQRKVVDVDRKFEKTASKVRGLREQLQSLKQKYQTKLMDAVGKHASKFESLKLRSISPSSNQTVDSAYVEFPVDQSHWKMDGYAFANPECAPVIVDDKFEFTRPGVISSGGNGMKFLGVAHSSTFEVKHKFIHVRMKSKRSTVAVVVDGVRMNEFNGLLFRGLVHKNVNFDDYQWLTIGGELYLYDGNRAWLEFRDEGDAHFAIDRVVFSNNNKPPSDEPIQVSKEVLAGENGEAYVNDVTSWCLQNDVEKSLGLRKLGDRIRKTQQKIISINKTLPRPQFSLSIVDGFPEDEYVFIRGNHKMKGKVAPRQFLTALVDDDETIDRSQGSGRLHLARQIVDPSNPLTSRVIVNRVWHHLFGRGIVKSVDNFGVLGEQPSHPELLDHLADEFVKDGWSLKRLIRKLMLTDAYARSSSLSAEAQRQDPDNVYLSRANVRRLQGEAIRDSMLVASGTLNRKMYGGSVPIHITPFMSGRGRPGKSGPLDGNGRRSIYIETRRNFLSPMMLAFDTPAPFNAIGMRTVSNVPAQALIMMNDPLVIDQAGRFAERVLGEESKVEDRIHSIWMNALSRPPEDHELKKSVAFLESHARQIGKDAQSPEVWKDFCHVVFNLKEYIYLN